MHWLYDLPVPLLAALLLALCISYALGAVVLVRRRRWQLSADDNGIAAALHALVGVMYAVALGLLVVSAQEDYGEVEQAVVSEANATGNLYRVIMGLEPANRDRLHHAVERYVYLVVNDEWPATHHGRESPRTWAAINAMATEIYTFRPATPQEERVYPQLVGEMAEVLDARRLRLFLGSQGVGPLTWTIVLLGGAITVGFTAFFGMSNERAQALLTTMMAAVFGLMLTLLVAMDHPLWGSAGVSPGAFLELQENWTRLELPPPRGG
jgi:hypothetical protein